MSRSQSREARPCAAEQSQDLVSACAGGRGGQVTTLAQRAPPACFRDGAIATDGCACGCSPAAVLGAAPPTPQPPSPPAPAEPTGWTVRASTHPPSTAAASSLQAVWAGFPCVPAAGGGSGDGRQRGGGGASSSLLCCCRKALLLLLVGWREWHAQNSSGRSRWFGSAAAARSGLLCFLSEALFGFYLLLLLPVSSSSVVVGRYYYISLPVVRQPALFRGAILPGDVRSTANSVLAREPLLTSEAGERPPARSSFLPPSLGRANPNFNERRTLLSSPSRARAGRQRGAQTVAISSVPVPVELFSQAECRPKQESSALQANQVVSHLCAGASNAPAAVVHDAAQCVVSPWLRPADSQRNCRCRSPLGQAVWTTVRTLHATP